MRRSMTWKRFFESRLFFVVGIALLVLFSVNLTRAQLKDRAIREEIGKLQADADARARERAGYEQLRSLLDTPAFLEKEARQTLGYAKPGEQVVVIDENRECRMQNAECETVGEAKGMSNPRKWWVYFFGGS